MSTWNILNYAVSGLDNVISDVTHTFVNHIVGKFPYGTFDNGSIYIDTMGLINDYKRRDTGLENPNKVKKPYLQVSINGGISDVWSADDNGPSVKQFPMFPGTTTDRRLNSSHRLGMIVDNEIGIRVDTVEIRRKLELTFKFDFDTKADLNTFKSHVYNTIPLNKNNYLDGVKAEFILPNSLVNDIIKLSSIKDTIDYTDQKKIDGYTKYMDNHSLFKINQKVSDVKSDDLWYTMDRVFRLSYYISKMDTKDGDGSNKDGESYEKFELELGCVLDFKMPNSYIMNYKVFNAINKCKVSAEYFNNVLMNKYAVIPITASTPRYVEDREVIIPPKNTKYRLFIREEFMITESSETLQISNFLPFDTIYWSVLERLTPSERSGLFETHIYENITILDSCDMKEVDIISDIVYYMKKCNPNVSFMLFIYVDYVKLARLASIIKDRISKGIYPNIDPLTGKPYVIGSNPPSSIPGSGNSGTPGYTPPSGGIGGDSMSGGIAPNGTVTGKIDTFNVGINTLR